MIEQEKETKLRGFALRRCQVGDAAVLSLLAKATFLETYAGTAEVEDILAYVESEHSISSYQPLLESPTATIWIAETSIGRAPIGYAVVIKGQNRNEHELKRLYVLYRFHREGIGQGLLNQMLDSIRDNPAAELFLKVQKVNEKAIGFYARNGFRVVGEEPFPAGERDYTVLVMRLVR